MTNKIMLVNSCDKSISNLKDKIESDGFSVLIVADPGLVLESAINESPDVIVMEYELGGLELCQCLNANYKTKNIPIVLMSNRSSFKDTMLALKYGCIDFWRGDPAVDTNTVAKLRLYARISDIGSTCRLIDTKLHNTGAHL